MRAVATGLIPLICTLAAAGPPTVRVPAEVAGPVAGFIAIRAESDGAAVMYYPIDAGLNVFPADLLSDRKATVVTAAKPGRYRLIAYTGTQDGPSPPVICTVVVGDAPPVPPGPGPDPGPAPAPDGELGLRRLSREGAARVKAAVRDRQQQALADAISSHASAVAAGSYDQHTGDAYAAWVMHGMRQATSAVATAEEWRPWTQTVSPALERLYRTGVLADKSKWAAAFSEIAQGLED